MQYRKYHLEFDSELLFFEFESVGPKGSVKKVIQYSQTIFQDVYNLGFGDKDDYSEIFNDQTETNNDDIYSVLAAVIESVYIFTESFGDIWVYFEANDLVRNRLYRMVLTLNHFTLKKDFEILGFSNEHWQEFQPNKNFEAFLVQRKKH